MLSSLFQVLPGMEREIRNYLREAFDFLLGGVGNLEE